MTQFIRYSIYLVTYLMLFFGVTFLTHATEQKRVLMVLSGNGQDNGQTAPGFEFEEFAKAYLIFKQNGLDVDIASPKGGSVEADKYDPNTPFNQAVLSDARAMEKLNNTLSTQSISAQDYVGVFVVGGKGAMFDLPTDSALQSLIATIYQRKGTVAAVCHGPAALVNVTLDDGSYLVANKKINGFTNLEETLFGSKWMEQFDFMLQDKLIARGGKFESSDIMLSHVAVDDRLITGQNPSSTVAVALALVESLGIEAATPVEYRTDKTLNMIALLLAGDKRVAQTLKADDVTYKLDLVSMYGYYYAQTATSNAQFEHALALMQVGQDVLNNPRLDMEIAQIQYKLGDTADAVNTLTTLLGKHQDFAPASELLQTLTN